MTAKTKKNILTLIFAILIATSLILATKQIWGAALGTAFFAFLIWNNKLRKVNNIDNNTIDNNTDNSK